MKGSIGCDSQPCSYIGIPFLAIFLSYPSVVDGHSLFLLVRVKLGIEVNIRVEGTASPAGLVAMSPYSILKWCARVCK